MVWGQLINDVRLAKAWFPVHKWVTDRLNDTTKYKMKVNVDRTKTMVVSRDGEISITTDGQILDQVTQFKRPVKWQTTYND